MILFPPVLVPELVQLTDGYWFLERRHFVDAWGNLRVEGVLFDTEEGTVQVDAHCDGPGWMKWAEVVTGAWHQSIVLGN